MAAAIAAFVVRRLVPFFTSLQYLDSNLEVTDLDDGEVTELDFEPILLRLGLAYRF